MTNVTNTSKQPLGLPSGIVVQPGETVAVPSWESDSGNRIVQAWVHNGILKADSDGDNESADERDEKDVLIEALAEYGITKTRRSSVEALQAALDEAKGEA